MYNKTGKKQRQETSAAREDDEVKDGRIVRDLCTHESLGTFIRDLLDKGKTDQVKCQTLCAA